MTLPKLTLRQLRARPVLLPLERPVVARIATIKEWPLILIDLETEEGITGRAYLEPYIPRTMNYLIPALEDFGEMFKGQQIVPAEFFDTARKSLHFVGYEGLSMIAVSGLDMAVWDVLARALDVPLCVLLGGSIGKVEAYNSNGLWLRPPEQVADEALELVAEGGFRGLKLRMGRSDPKTDTETLRAVRKAVGENVQIMADFNQGLDFAMALDRCHRLDSEGLAWIEEPIVYDNLEGYARLAVELHTPLMIGENFFGPRELYKAIAMQACDLVMPDFMRIGGVTGWLRSAPIAAAAGIPVSTHLYPEVGAHMLRVSETAHWLEWQSWADPILEEPYTVADGLLEIPNRPGLGLSWNEDMAARHLVS